ncbi:LysR family transcriptional regulator [Paraburkholderia sediminicola]|uniref:LysR family transcriptional regulator n=1 Tax=Paraburkholderia sediminicola TaxID=458836 RepID=UPI0038B74FC5
MDQLLTIRVFVEVAREGSFTRAADRLALSRSMITRHIAALESRLKTRLINRDTRKLSLTEAGESYFERTRNIVGQLSEAETFVTSFASVPSGRLRVVAPVVFGQRNLGPVLHAYRQQYPDVLLDLTLSDAGRDLIAQGYDVGILPDSEIRGVTWVTRPLVSTPVVACASPAYIAWHGLPRNPRDLVDHACVHSGGGAERVFHGPEGEVRVTLQSALLANDFEVLRQAALAGMGVGLLPAALVRQDLKQGALVALLTNYGLRPRELHIVYASKSFLPLKIRTFVDHLVAHFMLPETVQLV